MIGDRQGDVRAYEGHTHGFFSDDTRFLSRWVLNVTDAPLVLLGLEQSAHFAAQFFLTPRLAPHDQAPCSIIRRRVVDQVWIEEITVANHLHESNQVHVAIEVDTDFADLFEVKDGAVADRDITCHHDGSTLTLGYERADFRRSITISSSVRRGSPGMVLRTRRPWLPASNGRSRLTVHRTPRSPAHASPSGPRGAGSTRSGRRRRLSWRGGWLGHPPWRRTTPLWLARTARALPTSARCECTELERGVRRCPPPGCLGSWRCSAATA